MAYAKKVKEPKEAKPKKLSVQELIQVGAFTVRLGNVLAELDTKKVQLNAAMEHHTNNYNDAMKKLDEKIELIQSDPVKYFKTLDTNNDGLLGSMKSSATGDFDTFQKATLPVVEKDKVDVIIDKLDSVYKQNAQIGDMIYHDSKSAFQNRDRDRFDRRF